MESVASGATITAPRTLIQGKYNGAATVPVLINGQPACRSGSIFYLNDYPITADTKTIDVEPADGKGASKLSLPIKASDTPTGLTVTGVNCGGVGPYKATFHLTFTQEDDTAIDKVRLFIDGSTSAAYESGDPTVPITQTFMATGLHRARFVLTVQGGKQYEQTVLVNVLDQQTVQQQMQAIYAALRTALTKSDTNAALQSFTAAAKERYQPALQQNAGTLAKDAATWSDLEPVEINDSVAAFSITATQNGVTGSHHIIFMVDTDGQWKIDAL
jgi:hypothetical protein